MMTPDELKARCLPIIDAAGAVYGVDRVLILGKCGRGHVVAARCLAMYLCYRLTGASQPQLAVVFCKWHTAISRAVTTIERQCASSAMFQRSVNRLLGSLPPGSSPVSWRRPVRRSAA
jgi:chromosomal replication initiation ATPase DnaA